MKQTINFNSGQVVKITEENISGILIDIKALNPLGEVCLIDNLNLIPFRLTLKRAGDRTGIDIIDQYLENVLRAYHSGSTRYQINTTPQGDSYLIKIPFDGDLNLAKGDELTIEMKAPLAAFVNVENASSDITFETIPALKTNNPFITVVRSQTYPSGSDQINEAIGSNIVKLLLVNDFTDNYLATKEARPVNGLTLEASGFIKDVSENLLILENLEMLQLNPETPIKDLIIYNSHMPLMSARLKVKFDKAVLNDARIMMLQRVIV